MTERPATSFDPMGVNTYLINGKVIGKKRVYDKANWNPLVQVEKWSEFNAEAIWIVRIVIFLQIFIWSFLLKRKNNDA